MIKNGEAEFTGPTEAFWHAASVALAGATDLGRPFTLDPDPADQRAVDEVLARVRQDLAGQTAEPGSVGARCERLLALARYARARGDEDGRFGPLAYELETAADLLWREASVIERDLVRMRGYAPRLRALSLRPLAECLDAEDET